MTTLENLAFANLRNHVQKIMYLSGAQEVTFVALSHSAAKEFERYGVKYKTHGDYFTEEDMRNIDALSHSLMQTWFKYKNITLLGDVEIGDLFTAFYNVISQPLRDMMLLERAIQTENPCRVTFVNNPTALSKLITVLCKRHKIPFSAIKTSICKDMFVIFEEYLSTGGYTDIRNVLLGRFGLKRNKEINKPVSTSSVLNLFKEFYPYFAALISSSKFESLVLHLFRHLRPSYHTFQTSNMFGLSWSKNCRGKILAKCSFENDVKTLAPIIQELNQRNYKTKAIITHPDSIAKCLELQVPFESVGNYVTLSEEKEIATKTRKFQETWKQLAQDKEFAQIFNVNGYPLFESVKPALFLFFNVMFEYAVALITITIQIFAKERPDLVIVSDDIGFAGRAFVRIAKNMNIPTLNIQHSTIDDLLRYKDTIADKMALWGNISKELLLKSGISEDKLVITGTAKFDGVRTYVSDSEKIKERVHATLGIPSSENIAVWTPSPYDGIMSYDSPLINEETLRVLSQVFSSLKDKRLVVKIHPLDSVDLYKKVLSEINDSRTILIKNINLMELLSACDFLMVCNSTTGIEAMAIDKPVIIVNFHKVPENVPYAKSGAALRATNRVELESAIQILQDSQEKIKELAMRRKKFLENYLYRLDGNSCERIADLAEELIHKNEMLPRLFKHENWR